uniref:Uncharacterized protein n=1 Tax=Candidatus Kentrum eta TaxID=2126337 RepID=A0A450V6D3_9GAMM|nr:MAG: hypothetical protein BECKH772A_GA0070896_100455 [Candidatus Kentron sp. H]VFJ93463.1 MAG: hypothetical protein BECKH772B_GA0070898_100456 [Candidatus Kentron sp. H]VFK00247.1 MAG: hypothetical protein BECKH772C_GA0070978_100426 [Candidatus Kentron sp. H]
MPRKELRRTATENFEPRHPTSKFGIPGLWRTIGDRMPSNPHRYPMGPDTRPSARKSEGQGPYPVAQTRSAMSVGSGSESSKSSLELVNRSSELAVRSPDPAKPNPVAAWGISGRASRFPVLTRRRPADGRQGLGWASCRAATLPDNVPRILDSGAMAILAPIAVWDR